LPSPQGPMPGRQVLSPLAGSPSSHPTVRG
jgi:hypothetical protein